MPLFWGRIQRGDLRRQTDTLQKLEKSKRGIWIVKPNCITQERIFADKLSTVMTVTIETSGIQEVEQLLVLLKTLNIKNIKIQSSPSMPQPNITRGDKKIDPKQLFGIWKDNPRNIEQIRSTAWKRNWNI